MLMTCKFLPSGALFSTASGHDWQSRQTFQPCCVTEEKQEIVKAFKRKLEVDNVKLRVFPAGQGEGVDVWRLNLVDLVAWEILTCHASLF